VEIEREFSNECELLAIEVMGADVVENSWGQERRGGGVRAGVDLAAEFGGADVVVEAWKDGEFGDRSGCVAEAISAGRAGERGDVNADGHELHWIREGRKSGWGFGTGGNDEVGGEGDFGGATPVVEGAQGVGAEEEKEFGICRKKFVQLGQGIDGVVGLWVAGDGGVG
jgi:hypothetical protein